MKYILTALTIAILISDLYADGRLMSWGHKDLIGMTQERFESSRTWEIANVLERNLTVDEWPEVYLLLVASNEHKDKIFRGLIDQISIAKQVKLRNTGRLIIWERIAVGDILFEGKGLQVNDDLFSVAGRANWILRNITGKNFGYVKPYSTIEDLTAIQKKWNDWVAGKSVEEYRDPYEFADKSLSEIKSIEALEAIIVSLKHTVEKETLMKSCLKNIYNLDKFPDDPGSPAHFCNPDTYSNMYLFTLTGIKDHDAEWWAIWWDENKTRLAWNKANEKFEVK